MPGRLWVIDPSVSCPEEQGVAEIVEGWRGESRIFRPALELGDGPGPGSGYALDGLVVMGSSSSVHERTEWCDRLSAWLKPVLNGERPIPLLGICFGHQLVAHLAGGEVGYLDPSHAKRVGVETSRLRGGSLLAGDRDLRVVVSHREIVERAPAGYRVVAQRDGVRIDGLEHERLPIFTFQFHPEARDAFARRAGIAESLIDARLRNDSTRLLAAFRSRVRLTHAANGSAGSRDSLAP